MRLLKFISLLFVPIWISAQTTTQNYVATSVPYQAVSNPVSVSDANSNSVIKYYDGIGRLSQTVQKKITPSSADLVSAVEYDALGRLSKTWLPAVVSGNNGAYYSSYASNSVSANGDTKPYATNEYDGSPLNRVTGQYGPGNAWYSNSKKVATAFLTNGSDVKYFYVENNKLKRNGNYNIATLHGVQITDEDGKTVVVFTDKLGRKILSRAAGDHDTYFVYDDFGYLRYVLPPLAADNLSTNFTAFSEESGSTLDFYGYIYRYDSRGRLIEKKLPGSDWIHMVYDKADRLILTQDGNQRNLSTKQWTATKYDKYGRVLYVGLVNSNNTRSQMESSYSVSVTNETYSGNGSTGGYSCTNLAPVALLSVNYYDNYTFLNFATYSTIKNTLTNTVQSGYTNPDLTLAKSLLTGTCTYHLDDPAKFELTALYYDKFARLVQSRANNHMAGYDIVYYNVDFTGKITKTYKTHGINGASASYNETYTYTFDNAQRPLKTTHKVNNGTTVTISTNTYDNFGRLATKKVGGTLNTTTYTYNVRGWIAGLSNSEFSEQLYYNENTVSLPDFIACYNGNISGMKWNVDDEHLAYHRAYAFKYDNLNRLEAAYYCGKNGSDTHNPVTGKYNTSYSYDKMGNIQTLVRLENGSNLNNLTYTYYGNQLKKVDNAWSPTLLYGSEAFNDRVKIATEYIYDKNGNTIYDGNAGISTSDYNLLNLPRVIQFKDGHQNRYTYSAGGNKLKSEIYILNSIINVPQGTINPVPANPSDYSKVTTDYVGNLVYQDGSLKQIQIPGGYWQNGLYYYYLTDHLGNTRVVINSSGTVVEKNHYYPFGMRFYPESTSNSAALPFRYNGKEFERMNGLNRYDYGARFYDPAIGRWTTIDPLAEKFLGISPYAYCFNNPISNIDRDGREPITLTVIALKMAIGAGIGAVTDISVQMTANMTLQGQSFGQAFKNVDWTSVGASAAIGAVAVPGITTVAKTATIATAVAVDAAVDYSTAKGSETIFTGEKTLGTAVIDAAGSALGGKTANSIIDGAKTAISKDIQSGTYSTLTKAEKATLQQTSAVVNSTGATAGVGLTVGLGTEAAKQGAKNLTGGSAVGTMQTNTQVAPADATRVALPDYLLRTTK